MKQSGKIEHNAAHRIIIPVHIPGETGYYEQMSVVFRTCLESVLATKCQATQVTIVNNGSIPEVRDYIQEMFNSGCVDQVVHYKANIGKTDAVVAAVRMSHEDFITVSDADVMFMQGWERAVADVFRAFPDASMVSPVSYPAAWTWYTNSTILPALMARKLRIFEGLADESGLKMTSNSFGRADLFSDPYDRYQLGVHINDFHALVGAGHFVYTMRSRVKRYIPAAPSRDALSGWGDQHYVDVPVDRSGGWRLSTRETWAYHIGNEVDEICEALRARNAMIGTGADASYAFSDLPSCDDLRPLKARIRYFCGRLFKRFVLKTGIRPIILKWLGLPTEISYKY